MIGVLANALVPVFAGLFIGYVAGMRKVVDNNDVRTLITFVMSFAVPCALFTTIVRTPHPQLWGQSKVALVLAFVYLALYGLTYFSARALGRLGAAESSVLSLTLAFPNVAAVGIPLLPALYGSSSAITAAVGLAVGAVIVSPITVEILEINKASRDRLSTLTRFRVSLWKVVENPVVWAPMLGVVVVALNVTLPPFVDHGLALFATATAGTSVFLTGLVVSAQRFSLTWDVGWSVVGKNLLQPALCLAVARLLRLPLEQTRDVVLISAMPCGFFGVVFGKSFEATPDVASSSLIASTVVGAFTLAGWTVLSSHLP